MSREPCKGKQRIVSLDTRRVTELLERASVSTDTSVDHVKKFAGWLQSHGDIDKSKFRRRRLLTLYAEFCEFYDVSPLSQGRFDKALKLAGFQKQRLSSPGRPWVYVLRGAEAGVEIKPAVNHTSAPSRRRGER